MYVRLWANISNKRFSIVLLLMFPRTPWNCRVAPHHNPEVLKTEQWADMILQVPTLYILSYPSFWNSSVSDKSEHFFHSPDWSSLSLPSSFSLQEDFQFLTCISSSVSYQFVQLPIHPTNTHERLLLTYAFYHTLDIQRQYDPFTHSTDIHAM